MRGIGVADLVVAGDPGAHVFSFQGTTNEPITAFVERTPGAITVELTTCHRAPVPPEIAAWVAPHTSEEHAAIARELRRRHVEDGVEWSDLAVVLRRQGAHLGGLLRSLDDAHIPRAVPERGLSLTAEPATFPYVLALRWLVADPAKRDELIEPLLTSDVVGLSAATARGLLRVARATRGSIAEALDVTEGLTSEEASLAHRCARRPREGRTVRGHVGAGCVPRALGGPALLAPAREPGIGCGGARAGLGRGRGATPARHGCDVRQRGGRGGRGRRRQRGRVRGGARCRRARPRLLGLGARASRRRPGAHGARRGRPGVRHRHRGRRGRGELPEPDAPRAHVRSGRAGPAGHALRAHPRASGGRTPPLPDGRGPGEAARHPHGQRGAPRRGRPHQPHPVRRRGGGEVDHRAGGTVRRSGQRARGLRHVAPRTGRPSGARGPAARRAGGPARPRRGSAALVVPSRLDGPGPPAR